MLFNADQDAVSFVLPAIEGDPWESLLDTACAAGVPPARRYTPQQSYRLEGRSLAVLTRRLTVP